MEPGAATADIARIIQLAVAPVFLIAGIGALLNVLTTRLGRAFDRSRRLEAELASGELKVDMRGRMLRELKAVDGRIIWINVAVTLSTVAALLNCLVIVTLFTGELMGLALSRLVAVLFIATMAALIGALLAFLGEVAIALRTLRVRSDAF